MKPRFFALKSLLVVLALSALSLALATDVTHGLDRLDLFAGTWKTESQNYDTPYSKAGKVSSTLVNQCWKTGAFFICNQSVNGISRVLLTFTYLGGDSYGVTYVPADGGHASSGRLIIAGGVWTYPGQQVNLGQTTYFRNVNIFSNRDNIDFREEYSTDQQNWTLMAQGHETRVR